MQTDRIDKEGVGETEVRAFRGPAACRTDRGKRAERIPCLATGEESAGWARASEISPTPSAFSGAIISVAMVRCRRVARPDRRAPARDNRTGSPADNRNSGIPGDHAAARVAAGQR